MRYEKDTAVGGFGRAPSAGLPARHAPFAARALEHRPVMFPRRARRPVAFTLVELLVVLGIVLLLVGIVLPSLSAARRRAATVRGLANLSQIGRGAYAYAEAQDQTLPIGYLHTGGPDDTSWLALLDSYLGGGLGAADSLFQDPNAGLPGGRSHYSAHPVLMPDLSPRRPPRPPYRVDRFVRAARVLLVMDGAQDPLHGDSAHATLWQLDDQSIWEKWIYDGADADNADPIDPGPNRDVRTAAGTPRWRQPGGAANLLFGDGRAATTPPPRLTKGAIRVD